MDEFIRGTPESSLRLPPYTGTALQWFGAACLAHLTYRVIRSTSIWMLPNQSMSRYLRGGKAWAVVTGASAGIGLGCAQELAARGFNVVLVGHLATELAEARDQIKSESPNVDVMIHVIDCASATAQEIEGLVNTISSLPVTVLVNNVGGVIAGPPPSIKMLHQYTGSQVDATINLNVRFMTHLIRLMTPLLAANGPSLILNLSSGARDGLPGVAVYSGTKSFVSALSYAVNREARLEGLKVNAIAIITGLVKTQANVAVPAGTITGRGFAKEIMDHAPRAASRGDSELAPYWLHAMQTKMLDLMPEWLFLKVVSDSSKEMMKLEVARRRE